MQKGKKFSKETKINKRTSATLGQIVSVYFFFESIYLIYKVKFLAKICNKL